MTLFLQKQKSSIQGKPAQLLAPGLISAQGRRVKTTDYSTGHTTGAAYSANAQIQSQLAHTRALVHGVRRSGRSGDPQRWILGDVVAKGSAVDAQHAILIPKLSELSVPSGHVAVMTEDGNANVWPTQNLELRSREWVRNINRHSQSATLRTYISILFKALPQN